MSTDHFPEKPSRNEEIKSSDSGVDNEETLSSGGLESTPIETNTKEIHSIPSKEGSEEPDEADLDFDSQQLSSGYEDSSTNETKELSEAAHPNPNEDFQQEQIFDESKVASEEKIENTTSIRNVNLDAKDVTPDFVKTADGGTEGNSLAHVDELPGNNTGVEPNQSANSQRKQKETIIVTDRAKKTIFGNNVSTGDIHYEGNDRKLQLSDISSEYRPSKSSQFLINLNDADKHLIDLKKSRILFISARSGDAGQEAVDYLISKLDAEVKLRELHLDKLTLNEKEVELMSLREHQLLSKQKKEKKKKTVLVANVATEIKSWRAFYDSLFINQASYNSIRNEYEDLKVLFILFNVSGQDPRSVKECHIPVWKVSYFNDYHHIKLGEIIKKIEATTPVHKVVWFVATFFQDLDFRMFQTIIDYLVEQIEVVIEVPRQETDKDGNPLPPKEFSAQSYWKDNSDAIIHQCEIIQTETNKQGLCMRFANRENQEVFRVLFWNNYPGFMHRQFEVLCNQFDQGEGLLFSPMVPEFVNKKMTSLSVEMASADKRFHNDNWLNQMVSRFQHKLEMEALNEGIKLGIENQTSIHNYILEKATHHNLDGNNLMVRMGLTYKYLMESEEFKTISERLQLQSIFFFDRLSDLLWEMMQKPDLQSVVEGYCENSLSKLDPDNALQVIDRLAFSPHFDEHKWIEKLLEYNLAATHNEEELITILKHLHSTFFKRPLRLVAATNFWLKRLLNKRKKAPKEFELLTLGFLWEHHVVQIIHFPISKLGTWPSEFFLFQKDKDGGLKIKVYHKMLRLLTSYSPDFSMNIVDDNWHLANVLFLRGKENKKVFFRGNRPYQHYQLFGDLVEEWYLILTGCQKVAGEAPPQVTQVFLRTIKELLPPKWEMYLFRHWNAKVGIAKSFYNDMGGRTIKKVRKHKLWPNRHFAIRRLIIDFKNA